MKEIIENYHLDAVRSFRNYKTMAERAIDQVSDEEFFTVIDAEANSIAVIVKHIAGNLRSRWTDFLTLTARSRTGTATLSSSHGRHT